MNRRIVFMGSPDFAVPVLQSLAANYRVIGVVTQPDRPSGRGKRLTPPPVKVAAERLQLPLIQPDSLRRPESVEQLRRWDPDLIIVAAFGQILSTVVLELPKFGCLNVHASLLPRWRGAAPIPAAILNGDAQTGVSLMLMDAGIDSGPVLCQKTTPILPDDTAGSLSARLSQLGAQLLLEVLPDYLLGRLSPVSQDNSLATLAPMLTKRDGLLDFNLSAEQLVRQVRAFNPWPGTYTFWKDEILKVHQASSNPKNIFNDALPAGSKIVLNGLPAILTADGALLLEELQPAGKKPLPGNVFLQGAHNWGVEIDRE